MTKALVVSNEALGGLVKHIFKTEVDFNGLSKIIDSLGDVSKDLTKEEKDTAIDILNEWNRDVIRRLRDRSSEMSNFVNFLDIPEGNKHYCDGNLSDEIQEELSKRTVTNKLYTAYTIEKAKLNELSKTSPVYPEKDADMTDIEYLELKSTFEVESLKYKISSKKQNRLVYKRELEWKKALNKNKEIINLITCAKKFNSGLKKLIASCEEKTKLAKLNVAVSSKEARESLKELLNFCSQI